MATKATISKLHASHRARREFGNRVMPNAVGNVVAIAPSAIHQANPSCGKYAFTFQSTPG
jgi:hypothetical protein